MHELSCGVINDFVYLKNARRPIRHRPTRHLALEWIHGMRPKLTIRAGLRTWDQPWG
jgi:hypothetical protein